MAFNHQYAAIAIEPEARSHDSAGLIKRLLQAPSAERARAILEVKGSPYHPTVSAGDLICVDFTKTKLCWDGLYIVSFADRAEWIGIRRFQRLPGEWWISENDQRRPFQKVTPEQLADLRVIGLIVEVYKKGGA